jgi:peptide/nickel transport system permease protein
MIGFIVVLIETFIGVILGGIAGYFGKWIDNLLIVLSTFSTPSPRYRLSSSSARSWTACASTRRSAWFT